MEIFEQEKIDGLEDLILASQSETYQSSIKISPKKTADLSKIPFLASLHSQDDLYVYNSILCTAGEPNGNDICFLADRVLAAKDTPVNKQVNLNHTDDVVGHMVSSYLVNDDYEPLDYDPDNPPSYFHVLVESVIYGPESWKTEDRSKKISTLIEEVEDDKWCVSLECLSLGFDYAFINSEDNSISIIERNKDTAYLTKYLKKFKGAGEFDGKRIYCAPKDFIFSGEGLTQNPANLKSVIVADKNENVYLNVDENMISIQNNLGDNNMTEDQIKQAIKDALSAHYANLTPAVGELKSGFDFAAAFEALNKAFASVNEKVDSFITNYNEKVGKLEVDVAAKDEQIISLTASLDTVSKEKDVVVESLNKELAEKSTNIRLAKAIHAGLDEASAKTFVANTNVLSDEQFDAVLENVKLKDVATQKPSTTNPTEDIERIESSEPEPAPLKVTASSENELANEFLSFWNSKETK